MSEVVSFRADDDEIALIENTRRRLGLETRAQAVRHLLREGAKARRKFSETRLAKFRLPKEFRSTEPMTSRDIDAFLYDDVETR